MLSSLLEDRLIYMIQEDPDLETNTWQTVPIKQVRVLNHHTQIMGLELLFQVLMMMAMTLVRAANIYSELTRTYFTKIFACIISFNPQTLACIISLNLELLS